MPEMRILKRTRRAHREGKLPIAGLIREEAMDAIQLAKARRAGVGLRAPKRVSAKTRVVVVEREVKRAKKPRRVARRAAALLALKRAGRKASTRRGMSRGARNASAKRKGNRRASATPRSRARKSIRRSRARSMR